MAWLAPPMLKPTPAPLPCWIRIKPISSAQTSAKTM
jgi:hypothetical protein